MVNWMVQLGSWSDDPVGPLENNNMEFFDNPAKNWTSPDDQPFRKSLALIY